MKARRLGFFRRIAVMIFALTTVLGLLFITITYFSTTRFHEVSTQLLNKDVAAHIAKFTSPFERDGLNKQKADSVFHNAMVISPNSEVYFLDTAGTVIYFNKTEDSVTLFKLPLENIKKHISAKGEDYIKGPDPRDPSSPKIFSAAEVFNKSRLLGYIYVVFGSSQYQDVTRMLYTSHIGNLVFATFGCIIVVSIILSLLYINRTEKSFNRIVSVLQRFEKGDFEARFSSNHHDDFGPIKQAFNSMADLLVFNINRLTRIEKERKDFIANISHDLRPPLSIARGYTETLLIKKEKEGINKQELEEYVSLVLNKILQVENMVKQLFELSKMDSVEFTPRKEPFVFSEILQEAVNNFQLAAAEKKVSLKCTQCQYHVWINADIAMMERVVQNLVDNAVKGTPESGKIEVSLTVENNKLIFDIMNTGSPLTKELLDWINSYDDNETLFKRPRNLGLGLVIVNKILSLHKFSFKAQTQPSGNLFSIDMPIHQ
jgi:signal transduction histidine kinase